MYVVREPKSLQACPFSGVAECKVGTDFQQNAHNGAIKYTSSSVIHNLWKLLWFSNSAKIITVMDFDYVRRGVEYNYRQFLYLYFVLWLLTVCRYCTFSICTNLLLLHFTCVKTLENINIYTAQTYSCRICEHDEPSHNVKFPYWFKGPILWNIKPPLIFKMRVYCCTFTMLYVKL